MLMCNRMLLCKHFEQFEKWKKLDQRPKFKLQNIMISFELLRYKQQVCMNGGAVGTFPQFLKQTIGNSNVGLAFSTSKKHNFLNESRIDAYYMNIEYNFVRPFTTTDELHLKCKKSTKIEYNLNFISIYRNIPSIHSFCLFVHYYFCHANKYNRWICLL